MSTFPLVASSHLDTASGGFLLVAVFRDYQFSAAIILFYFFYFYFASSHLTGDKAGMYTPWFTNDKKRIERLLSNYEEGKAREQLSLSLREKLDMEALNVSEAHVLKLFEVAARQSFEIRKNRRAEAEVLMSKVNKQ